MLKVEFHHVETSHGIIRMERGFFFAALLISACRLRIENHSGRMMVVEFLSVKASLQSWQCAKDSD